ncbi:MAG: hypothetical protein J4F35_15850 [Candidatus Latescibacteria bacterium]|nr:hypothetical protein [Candidatus Latescibacterota bacterium]
MTLDKLGWERKMGEAVDSEDLRQRLKVIDDHKRLFRRMLEMLARSGVLEEAGDGFVVVVGSGDPLPEGMPGDPDEFATTRMVRTRSGCSGALALPWRRCCAIRRIRSRCCLAVGNRVRLICI